MACFVVLKKITIGRNSEENSEDRFFNFFIWGCNENLKILFVDLSKLYTCSKFHSKSVNVAISHKQLKVMEITVYGRKLPKFVVFACAWERSLLRAQLFRLYTALPRTWTAKTRSTFVTATCSVTASCDWSLGSAVPMNVSESSDIVRHRRLRLLPRPVR